MLEFYLFADDTNIYYEADTPDKFELILNRELKQLRIWLIVNRLSLNIVIVKIRHCDKQIASSEIDRIQTRLKQCL